MESCKLPDVPLFRGLTETEAAAAIDALRMRRRPFAKGEVLLEAGCTAPPLGVVLAGRVHMEHLDVWGSKTLLGQAGPGDLFAETYACLPEEPLLVSVVAAESGEVLLLSARSLALLRRLPMPGIVLDVALRAGTVYALCLNETLNSTLVTIPRAGARQILSLSGMPGRIACERGDVICATEGFLHTVSMDGMRLLDTRRVSGRASIWLTAGETLLLCDALSECIFARNGGGQWSLFCEHARDMRFLFGKG